MSVDSPFTISFCYPNGILFIVTIRIILRCFGNLHFLRTLFSRREFLCSLVALWNRLWLFINEVILWKKKEYRFNQVVLSLDESSAKDSFSESVSVSFFFDTVYFRSNQNFIWSALWFLLLIVEIQNSRLWGRIRSYLSPTFSLVHKKSNFYLAWREKNFFCFTPSALWKPASHQWSAIKLWWIIFIAYHMSRFAF